MNEQLKVEEVSVRFGDLAAVDRVSFELSPGEIGCLLGPSGCGKTSLLRAIAGFEETAAGEIRLGGSSARGVAPEHRRVGMVFQDFALFPHLKVTDNIAFGLFAIGARERRERTRELLDAMDLVGSAEKYPHELSGGQQQRVALARALAPRPSVLLLDEPFSSIDVELREQLTGDIRTALQRERITTLLVTHDQLEAFSMADRIGVMNAGRLRQWDTAYNLYHQPADRFVADFIGEGRMLAGEVQVDGTIRTAAGTIAPVEAKSGLNAGERGDVLIRPHDVILDPAGSVSALVDRRVYRGAEFLYTLRLESGDELLYYAPDRRRHGVGDRIGFRLRPGSYSVFAR